jgi:dihydroorotate dehydrogenase electron transfer subunit
LNRRVFSSHVVASERICREHYRLTLRVMGFPPTLPGQFVQIECGDRNRYIEPCEIEWREDALPVLSHGPDDPDWGAGAFLRRPFSLAGRRDVGGGTELEIIHRVVGRGTHWLAERARGDSVSLLGPLGNHFDLPPENGHAVLIGGGVGIPPMLYLAERLAERSAVAFVGAMSGDLLPVEMRSMERFEGAVEPRMMVGEFARFGIGTVVTTDDGSVGYAGRVTEALAKYLDALSSGTPLTLYTCGPELMMKAVGKIAAERGIECQIAVERAMACGMGTCQSCVIRCRATGRADGRDWVYKLACTDGPVFRGQELLW